MKLKFSLKNQEIGVEADVEKLIEKGMDQRQYTERKTRYQIKQEEKRKNAELKQKQKMQQFYIGIGALLVIMVIGFLIALLG